MQGLMSCRSIGNLQHSSVLSRWRGREKPGWETNWEIERAVRRSAKLQVSSVSCWLVSPPKREELPCSAIYSR